MHMEIDLMRNIYIFYNRFHIYVYTDGRVTIGMIKFYDYCMIPPIPYRDLLYKLSGPWTREGSLPIFFHQP